MSDLTFDELIDGGKVEPQPVKMTATKAIVGAVAAGIVSAGTSIVGALSDNIITPAEWVNALIALIVGAGLVGGSVYVPANKPKGEHVA